MGRSVESVVVAQYRRESRAQRPARIRRRREPPRPGDPFTRDPANWLPGEPVARRPGNRFAGSPGHEPQASGLLALEERGLRECVDEEEPPMGGSRRDNLTELIQMRVATKYSREIKARLAYRMVGPERMSLRALSIETGIPDGTLHMWRQLALEGKLMPMGANDDPSSPRAWPPEKKLKVLLEAAPLSGAALGEYLRRVGVHEAMLDAWRREILEALSREGGATAKEDQRRIAELEKELRRKDKALAEAGTLLILQKKARALLEGVDIDTTSPPGKDSSS